MGKKRLLCLLVGVLALAGVVSKLFAEDVVSANTDEKIKQPALFD